MPMAAFAATGRPAAGAEVAAEGIPVDARLPARVAQQLRECLPGHDCGLVAKVQGPEQPDHVVLPQEAVMVRVGLVKQPPQVPLKGAGTEVDAGGHKLSPADHAVAVQVHGLGRLCSARGIRTQVRKSCLQLMPREPAGLLSINSMEQSLDGRQLVGRPHLRDGERHAPVEHAPLREVQEPLDHVPRDGRLARPQDGVHPRLQEGGLQAVGSSRPVLPRQRQHPAAQAAGACRTGPQPPPGGLGPRGPVPLGVCDVVAARERQRQGEQLEQHHAAAENVGLGVDHALPGLRRHSRGRAFGPVAAEVPGTEDLRQPQVNDHDVRPFAHVCQRGALR
mmetsp:Transcript_22732/g.65532  ORF Transcript_22732/g.65532 Transcript_22732/m.65532 type:complete len:335 (-) Transcript_22732:1258-2262(-)